jgi:hypothetical protein
MKYDQGHWVFCEENHSKPHSPDASLNSDAKCNTPALCTYSIFLSSEPPSHLRNAAEGGGEEGKIRSFLGEPERPKVLHLASESTA